jgi:hypothetical protein
MSNVDTHTSALGLGVVPSVSGRHTGDITIIFNRYGDTYFLSTVLNGHTGAGFEVPVSQSERELARTASAQKYEVLGVLARR